MSELKLSTEELSQLWFEAQDQALAGFPAPFHFAKAVIELQERRTQPEANADAKDARRTGTLYVAIQQAAAELPEGWTISLEIERDAGTVELIDPEGERKLIDGNDGYLCQAVDAAIEIARQSTQTTDAPQAKGSEVDCG